MNGAGVAGARVELRAAEGWIHGRSFFRPGRQFPRESAIRREYVRVSASAFLYQGRGQQFESANQLTIRLNHLQEFADKVDVTYSPPAIDPKQTSERRELANAEMVSVPYPAPQDFRNALPLLNGVVLDNAGRVHFNGGDTNQANYTLDGFNISDPVTGRLEMRVNIDTIQSLDLESSRYSADNARGSSGVLDIKTKMGDDRWRFGGTNFIPGVAAESGLYINKWTPRLEFSGPLAKGRAWFHNGFDAFYSVDTVHGLPHGENRTRSLTTSNLTRFHVNLKPANILTGSFLYNLANSSRFGLSILNPVEATTSIRQAAYMSTLRDQHYFAADLARSGIRRYPRHAKQSSAGQPVVSDHALRQSRQLFHRRGPPFLPDPRKPLPAYGAFSWHTPSDVQHDIERELPSAGAGHDYEVLRDDNSVVRHELRAILSGAQEFRSAIPFRISGRRARG